MKFISTTEAGKKWGLSSRRVGIPVSYTHLQIYEAVFNLDGESDNSTISTHIKNIRAKLSKLDIQPITTVWGIGYRWE